MSDKVYIFSSGSQYSDWVSSNCERCTKYNKEGVSDCEIETALLCAYFDDGKVAPDIAERAGANEEENAGRYIWQCSEVDWTDEWKAEYLARNCEVGEKPSDS